MHQIVALNVGFVERLQNFGMLNIALSSYT